MLHPTMHALASDMSISLPSVVITLLLYYYTYLPNSQAVCCMPHVSYPRLNLTWLPGDKQRSCLLQTPRPPSCGRRPRLCSLSLCCDGCSPRTALSLSLL